MPAVCVRMAFRCENGMAAGVTLRNTGLGNPCEGPTVPCPALLSVWASQREHLATRIVKTLGCRSPRAWSLGQTDPTDAALSVLDGTGGRSTLALRPPRHTPPTSRVHTPSRPELAYTRAQGVRPATGMGVGPMGAQRSSTRPLGRRDAGDPGQSELDPRNLRREAEPRAPSTGA